MANQGVMTSLKDDNQSSETDFAIEASVGSFFSTDYKKNDDLKQMLDSNKDNLKLEAMKRIIAMVAKGRDASHLFPAVVKNVVSKNIEVKKLVYVYLARYAEEQQDLALLSISTFQRALKDPNQLIRASALRVLSSIRVLVIAPIMMLAIKDSSADMSPYVRKTAAHAIPKLYGLDPEQKEELVVVIEKLLMDRTTLVIGSAVMAFDQVCPERIDLIHKNFRKLCNLLVDVEEWGQVLILNMLTRYARSQFVDPNSEGGTLQEENKPFYDSERVEDGDSEVGNQKPTALDADHRLLLRNARPLLQSRNSAVVMAVAQLFYHLAPQSEIIVVAKPLIRLIRSHREVKSVVLSTIASMSVKRKGMFEPYLRSFFIYTTDPLPVKLMKLEILTNLAGETNISLLLREFQVYIASHESEFVAATIQAIGRCASNIKEVASTCLSGLVALLSNKDEAVVAESVVIIKKLLQSQSADQESIVTKMIKLVDNVTVPAARASILWLIGEYCEKVAKYAPDVLRKMAKSFSNEEDLVKLQIVNLAAKLYLTNPKQTTLLCQYVLNLAKYDLSYDIRDRSRMIRHILFSSNDGKVVKNPKKIFFASKPAPVLESRFKDRDNFQLGSLSHYLNVRANGYQDLPGFAEVAPDSSVRNVEPPSRPASANIRRTSASPVKHEKTKKKMFYSSSSGEDEPDENGKKKSSGSESSGTSDSESDSESSGSASDSEPRKEKVPQKTTQKTVAKQSSSSESGESGTSSESGSESESSESEAERPEISKPVRKPSEPKKPQKTPKSPPVAKKSNMDLLLDLDDSFPSLSTPVFTPTLGGMLTPMSAPASVSPFTYGGKETIVLSSPSFVTTKPTELLSRTAGNGLQVGIRYTRSPHLYSASMTSVELHFTNGTEEDMGEIKVLNKMLPSGMSMCDFPAVASLPRGQTRVVLAGIDFADSTQDAVFEVSVGGRITKLSIRPPIGETIRAAVMSEALFSAEQAKLRGMNESSVQANLPPTVVDGQTICRRIFEAANVSSVPSTDPLVFRFSGQTLSSKILALVTIKTQAPKVTVVVNCEKIIIGSILANQLKDAIEKP